MTFQPGIYSILVLYVSHSLILNLLNQGVPIVAIARADSVSLPAGSADQLARSVPGRTITTLVLILFTSFAGLILGFSFPRTPALPSSPPSIEQIRQVGLLSTLSVEVADVREVRIEGLTGGATMILILRGNVLLGVDLMQVKVISNDREQHQIVVELPQPTVTQARVDTQRSKVYRLDHSGLWAMRPQDELTVKLINSALADAQRTVTHAADREDLRELSRRQAQELITHYLNTASWKVEIRWRE